MLHYDRSEGGAWLNYNSLLLIKQPNNSLTGIVATWHMFVLYF